VRDILAKEAKIGIEKGTVKHTQKR